MSLDTLNGKIFENLTRRQLFSQVLEGFQDLIGKIPLKINCVPLRGVNDEEILKIAALAKNNSISVRFIELMPIGCDFESGLSGIPTAEIFSTLEKNFGGQIGFIDALEHKFCANCNRIRLTAEGFIKTCLSFDAGLDIKNLLRSDDKNLEEKIREAIYFKPKEHFFKDTTKFQMYQVGG